LSESKLVVNSAYYVTVTWILH